MPAQNPRGLRVSYAGLNSPRATLGITPRPGALPHWYCTVPIISLGGTDRYQLGESLWTRNF